MWLIMRGALSAKVKKIHESYYLPSMTPIATLNGISPLDSTMIAQHGAGLITLNTTQLIAADVTANGSVSPLDAAYIAQWSVGVANPGITGTWKFIPASRPYANVETAAGTAAELAGGVNEAAKGIAKILKWAPYIVAGIGAVGATAVVIAAARRLPMEAAS